MRAIASRAAMPHSAAIRFPSPSVISAHRLPACSATHGLFTTRSASNPAAGLRFSGKATVNRSGQFSGTYSCSSREVGTMVFAEMTNRVGMMSGRLIGQSTNNGCHYTGRFTGLDPNKP